MASNTDNAQQGLPARVASPSAQIPEKKRSDSQPTISLSPSLIENSFPTTFEGAGPSVVLNWAISEPNKCPRRTESPCDATTGINAAYFRRYRSRDIYFYDKTSTAWGTFKCEINDTTTVMMPIEFGREEALHIIGGKAENGSLVRHLHYYNESEGIWERSKYPPMHYARKQVAAVCHQEKYLIVVGGHGEHAPMKAVEILDLKEKKWYKGTNISFKQSKLQQVHSMNEVALLSHLAMYGTVPISALLEDFDCIKSKGLEIEDVVEGLIEGLELYDPKLDEELKKELQEKRHLLETALLKQLGLYRMSACICGDSLYILGGFTNIYGQSPLRTVFRAKLGSLLRAGKSEDYYETLPRNLFKSVSHLPYIRSAFVVLQGRLLAIGGSRPLRNNKCVGEVHEYHPKSDKWIKLTGSLCIPRCDCFAVTFDSKLMVIGGRPYNQDNPCTDSVEFAESSMMPSQSSLQNDPKPTSSVLISATAVNGTKAPTVGFELTSTHEHEGKGGPSLTDHEVPDLTLSLKTVYRETHDARAKWIFLLTELDITAGTIDAINESWRDPANCLRAGLSEWLQGGERSWRDVVSALSSPTVDRKDLADYIESKYLQK